MVVSQPLEPPHTTHVDEAQRAELRERLEHLLSVEDRRVEQMAADGLPPSAAHDHLEMAETIRGALGKLEQGTYGLCEGCNQAMPFERLEAMPYARLCVACQQRPRSVFG